MKKISINGTWKLYFFEQGKYHINNPMDIYQNGIIGIDCVVPGNVELDLSRAGYLPKDLYKGENILKVKQFENYEWWYETNFDTQIEHEGKKTELHFEGVDCLAEYWLNGEKIGESSNMLIPFNVDVSERLESVGENTLYVRLRSPIIEANEKEYPVYLTHNTWQHCLESAYIRKAPHSYGWDIMPRAVSAGIWKDVQIIIKEQCEIEQIFYHTKCIEKDEAEVSFCYELKMPLLEENDDFEIEICGNCEDSSFYVKEKLYFKAGSINIHIKNPKIWWPNGYGIANLYDTTAKVYDNGKIIAQEKLKVGIRTVELIRSDMTDGKDGSFKFKINHTDIMCKGTNWVALDAFHSRDAKRYDRALGLLKDIGCNIVRCWGGNVYEQKCFFDFCDENGIMIWQDFAMACHAYPQTDEFYKEIKQEVTSVVKTYRNHASVILWSGDNECDQLLYQMNTNPNSNQITRKIIPEVINNFDVERPYLPSSPFISQKVFENKYFEKVPENHLWGPRDYFKSKYYTTSKAHFISEIGYHGCPSRKSIEKFIDKEYIWPYNNNKQWNLHSSDQKNSDHRVLLMANQIKQLFGEVPDNLDDFTLASQISQAEAKKFFIENVRCQKPIKSGIIWWNLLDGWPQMSDSVVDYYFEKKLAYNYIKRSQKPFCIMVSEIENWNVKVIASNDTLEIINGHYSVKDADTNKLILEDDFNINENDNIILGEIPIMYSEKRLLLIEWTANRNKGFNHYICGLPSFSLEQYKKCLVDINMADERCCL